uniref:Uncharacterized protein n=1 Tax=Leptospira santarosai serovar Arenal str. MAVJ 401 TaxID=1049976 RepID=M6JGH1_9LEPT|nr:hypothetical protein LEP1GSC063_3156 [Leptospira santarosai serovar Arenal str. MAVJ 401]
MISDQRKKQPRNKVGKCKTEYEEQWNYICFEHNFTVGLRKAAQTAFHKFQWVHREQFLKESVFRKASFLKKKSRVPPVP